MVDRDISLSGDIIINPGASLIIKNSEITINTNIKMNTVFM